MPRRTKAVLVMAIVFLLYCFPTTCAAQAGSKQPNGTKPGNHTFSLRVGGLKRTYVVYVPTCYEQREVLPVVIVFHGGGGTAKAAMWGTGWARKAEQEGFLALFPEGSRPDPSERATFALNPQTWNDGSNRNNIGAVARKVADVDFVREMIHDLGARFKVDKQRIYATGFSNGASMTFRIGRELSQNLAAIAPVAGSDWSKNARIHRPIPLLYITGTSDPLNPIEGGTIHIGSKEMGNKPPVREFLKNWIRMLDCPPEPRVVYDKHGVKGLVYGPGRDNAEVVFYTIEEHGHTWPGGKNLLPERLVGKSSNVFKATDVIWEFFRRHQLQSEVKNTDQHIKALQRTLVTRAAYRAAKCYAISLPL